MNFHGLTKQKNVLKRIIYFFYFPISIVIDSFVVVVVCIQAGLENCLFESCISYKDCGTIKKITQTNNRKIEYSMAGGCMIVKRGFFFIVYSIVVGCS